MKQIEGIYRKLLIVYTLNVVTFKTKSLIQNKYIFVLSCFLYNYRLEQTTHTVKITD